MRCTGRVAGVLQHIRFAVRPMTRPIIAVDFDGVIHDPKNVAAGRRMGQPIDGAKAGMEALRLIAHVVVHTVRATSSDNGQHVRDWLDFYGIPYDDVTAIKPNAILFIDDRAIPFVNWDVSVSVAGMAAAK